VDDYSLMVVAIVILVAGLVVGALERRGNKTAKRVLDFLFGPKDGGG